MMFIVRRFFYKPITRRESDTAPKQKRLLIDEPENFLEDNFPSTPSKHFTDSRELRFVGKLLLLVVALSFALFSGQSVKNYVTFGLQALLRSNTHEYVPCSHPVSTDKPISVSAASPWKGSPVGAKPLTSKEGGGWNFNCSSSDPAHNCSLAFDGDEKTYWQSGSSTRDHSLTIDLKSRVNITSLAVKPAQLKPPGGSVRKHRVEVATQDGSWELVALGTWRESPGGEHNATSTFRVLKADIADEHC